jgi:hypothetical protein
MYLSTIMFKLINLICIFSITHDMLNYIYLNIFAYNNIWKEFIIEKKDINFENIFFQ